MTKNEGSEKPVIFFVSHDASRTGAPLFFGELLNSLVATSLPFRPLIVVTGKGPLLSTWRSAGFDVVSTEKRQPGSLPVRFLARIVSVLIYLRLLAKYRPRIIYSNTIRNTMEVVLGRLAGARTLVHVHEGERMISRYASSLRFSSGFTSRYICVSQYSANSIRKILDRDAIVIPQGIRIGSEIGRTGTGRYSNEWTVGMIGGIQPNKGHHVAIEALAKLQKKEKGVSVRLRCFGEVENAGYRQRIEMLLSELNVKEKVEFCGTLSNISAIYEQIDFVLVASLDEAFPRVLLEAFLYERPVVASAVGGVLEIVRNEENGLLVGAGDAEGIATALHRLITNPTLAGDLVRTAAADVRQRFRLEDTLLHVRNEIEAILPERAS